MTELALRFGPFTAYLETPFAALIEGLRALYPPSALIARDGFCDFHVAVAPGAGARRWLKPQARFLIDGESPFKPLPAEQALPMFEWGLNYAIAAQAHHYLVIHAAAIERGGRVALLPGAPGAGKSTLTAALVQRGWRLLSDELALIRPADRLVVPLARPINLKNDSIAVMRAFAPRAVLSEEIRDTAKGKVALLRAPEASIARSNEAAPVGWIVFPHWQQGATAQLAPFSKAAALIEIAHHAMNYSLHGAAGFELLATIVEASHSYRFRYARLDDAVAAFADLG